MEKFKKMSRTEKEFMNVIWAADEPLSLQDFIDIFCNQHKKTWKNQTISTFLARLVKKGYLSAYRKGRVFYYQPRISKLEYSQTVINHSLGKIYGSPIERVIASFCGHENPDNQELEKIQDFLQDMADE